MFKIYSSSRIMCNFKTQTFKINKVTVNNFVEMKNSNIRHNKFEDKEIPIYEDKNFNNSLGIFYPLIHIPFYALSVAMYTNTGIIPINNFDIGRSAIKAYYFAQCLVCGINLSSLIQKSMIDTRQQMSKSNSIDLNHIYLLANQAKQELNIYTNLGFAPVIINLISINMILSSANITLHILQFSYVGILISNLINIYIAKKIFNGNSNNKYLFNLQLILAIANLIIILIFYKYIYNKNKIGINPLKRLRDGYRIEGLKHRRELEYNDMNTADNEMDTLFLESLSESDVQSFENLFNDKK
jgi:hypothetical protein